MRRTPASQAPPAGTLRSREQREAYLAILRVAEELQRQTAELLKAHDLSLAQYNVLRILRGSGSAGAACGEVAGKLIRHDPDVTRLMDRLERRGLTERMRDPKDRRIVRTHITAKGLELLSELDGPVDALHDRQLGHLSALNLADLTRLLDQVRTGHT